MLKQTLLTVPWPAMCDNCGHDLAEKINARRDLDVITTWCPHSGAFVMAYAGELEGRRGVVRWDVVGPIDRTEAEDMMAKLGAASASCENLDKPSLQ